MIDVRSDTVTRPTAAMLDAMMRAKVGDDVFGEDETVNALQDKAAALFGMEAALFFPTGTMSNQVGIRVHVRPGDEVICSENAHVYVYEGGGIASNAGASVKLLRGDTGLFAAADVAAAINNRLDSHLAYSRLVSIENTMNRGGGCCWDIREIAAIATLCRSKALALHLDGARLFNALVATGETAARYGALFDTISICLSKGLGTPAGSVLLGSREKIALAHRYRKAMGGGMRQVGYIAAAGLYALEHNIERLAEDHAKATKLAAALRDLGYVERVMPAETNLVIAHLRVDAGAYVAFLEQHGIRAIAMGPRMVRFVFHLDVSDRDLDQILDVVDRFKSKA
ncbi:MAG: GntG family PLP-dependent aldolase [Rhizomicrobium sp.]